MHEKRWRDYEMTVNGLPQRIRYNEATVEGLFLPLLHRLAALQAEKGGRLLVFLAAPPAFLRDRLIARKVQGGGSEAEATVFYETSDAPNVLRFAAHAGAADEVWQMEADGDFVRV